MSTDEAHKANRYMAASPEFVIKILQLRILLVNGIS